VDHGVYSCEARDVWLRDGYLDDNWMRVAEEAKRQGVVLTYHRFVERQGASESNRNIVLVTEFKNQQAYLLRESLVRLDPEKPAG
jgi:hypothetical protein